MRDKRAREFILTVTGADAIDQCESLQSLWSGYGDIQRVTLSGDNAPMTVIAKRIAVPPRVGRDQGAESEVARRRKIRSYEVEVKWYQQWSARCPPEARVPRCFGVCDIDGDRVIVLEDLDAAGFAKRKTHLTKQEMQTCLRWLANFHATFMHVAPNGLWNVGSYWHLRTRPDEYEAMPDGPLKRAAHAIDDALNGCLYKTIIHGDAKVNNFCFSHDGKRVAAVDFQYVGGGCGIKDVVYLFDSALSDRECDAWEDELLAYYFDALRVAVAAIHPDLDFLALQSEWTDLHAIACADFYRFLAGWSPQYRELSARARRRVENAFRALGVRDS